MPSLPDATQTLIEKMHAGTAEPQSSSAHAPAAISDTSRTVILPLAAISPPTFAFFSDTDIEEG
jgi:hypothetical protein